VQEETRSAWGWTLLEQLGQDVRYGMRSLRKSPSFAAGVALTVALGVGANTAIFSLFNAVLLQTLPVRNPGELVFPEAAGTAGTNGAPPYPCLMRMRDGVQGFAGLSIFTSNDELRVEIDAPPEQAIGQAVSGNYFDLLGVKASLGRLLEPEDEKLSPPAAVISDRYWRRRFGGSPDAIGKTIVYRRRTFTIVGVTPPEYLGLQPGSRVDVAFPISIEGRALSEPGLWAFHAIARLNAGVTAARARAEADAIFQSFMSEHRSTYPSDMLRKNFHHIELLPAARGHDSLRRRFSKPLQALMGIVGLLLLLAGANVANLLLARGISRAREFAIRLATGASRGRLVRQVIVETLLLCALGAIPGVGLSVWAVRTIEGVFAQGRRPIALDAAMDWRVLGFSMAVTAGIGLFAALLPARRVFRTDPEEALKEGHSRGGESRGAATASRVLVAFQVAVSLVLLVGAVTFVRTLQNLRNVSLGFRNDSVLTMSVEVPEAYARPEQAGAFWGQLLDHVRELPGVRAAAISVLTPLSGRDRGNFVRIRGYEPTTSRDRAIKLNQVSEGYFETLGIPVLRGRPLTAADAAGASKVALVNEAAARKYFGARDPIGEMLEFPGNDSAYRIAGVVGDTKHRDLRQPPDAFAYLPIRQPRESERRITLSVAAADAGAEMALVQPIRALVARTDSRMLVSEIITLRAQVDSTLLTERLLSGLAGAFGALAVILAAVGLYAVLSHHIGRQRQAIGIRMALGASASSIRRRVLRQSSLIVLAGLAAGLPFAVVASRAGESLFWGVAYGDPSIYLIAVGVLCAVGFVSAYIPARAASSIEPAEALRN
jgi:predicted permease